MTELLERAITAVKMLPSEAVQVGLPSFWQPNIQSTRLTVIG